MTDVAGSVFVQGFWGVYSTLMPVSNITLVGLAKGALNITAAVERLDLTGAHLVRATFRIRLADGDL